MKLKSTNGGRKKTVVRLPGTTSRGKPHTLKKATITEARLKTRSLLWDKAQKSILEYLQKAPGGEQTRMAKALGVNSSQIHRLTCPICEHNQEPSFSIGVAALLYVAANQHRPTIEIDGPEYKK